MSFVVHKRKKKITVLVFYHRVIIVTVMLMVFISLFRMLQHFIFSCELVRPKPMTSVLLSK